MPISLTPEEIAALLAEYQALTNSIASRQDAKASVDQSIIDSTNTDNAEKKAFDFYDLSIIRQYENEREALDGTYQENPVTKAELDALGALTPNRLFPTLPDTAPVRITEFDGGGLVTTDNQITGIPFGLSGALDIEPYWISRQSEREDWLVNGFGGTSPTITPTTVVQTAISPSTTQITIVTSVPTENPVFAVGNRFVVTDGSNQVGIEITNIVSEIPGDPDAGSCAGETPPGSGIDQPTCLANGGTWTPAPTNFQGIYDVIVLVPSTVTANSDIDETWAGFSNTDRTNKIDATDGYDDLLLNMLAELTLTIDNRILKLNDQKTALIANEDVSLDPQAELDVDSALSVLNTWKINSNIDDSELAILSSERATRSPQISARISAIGTAFTSPINLFDARYTSATNIGDTSRGTSRIKTFKEDTRDIMDDLDAVDQDRLTAIENLLILAGIPIP